MPSLRGRFGVRAAWVVLALLAAAGRAYADTQEDRFTAGGYFRVMTRPDFQGGAGKLGLWNLYGRLLNEGPYGALELKLNLLQPAPGTKDPWTSLHAKIEGGSIANADPNNGRLDSYRVSQLYVKTGNVVLEDVTWQLGTLDYYFGTLGLYDMRPAELFFETVGLSGMYHSRYVDVLLGAGDSGYFLRGSQYDTIFTLGGAVRLRLGDHVELGGGGQALFEPQVEGNRFAPHTTAGLNYEDFHRREVVQNLYMRDPMVLDPRNFPKPQAEAGTSWKVVGYLGFGKLGPLQWNNFFIHYQLRHPDNFYSERFMDRDYTIFVKDLTDERTQLDLGNELMLTVVPRYVDLVWGFVYGHHEDRDNRVFASEDNRTFWSTVLRLQGYFTDTVHFLAETSYANEVSDRGNLFREHFDSIFVNDVGRPDARGHEFGDAKERNTWQLKVGPVINPLGKGIWNRPSIRLLWGLQYSSAHNAFGSSFVETLDQFNQFGDRQDRHWHSVISLEAETWF